jgi:hypothetical protein
MQVCTKHDVSYPDTGTCWCCDLTEAADNERERQKKPGIKERLHKAVSDLEGKE